MIGLWDTKRDAQPSCNIDRVSLPTRMNPSQTEPWMIEMMVWPGFGTTLGRFPYVPEVWRCGATTEDVKKESIVFVRPAGHARETRPDHAP